MVFTEQQLQVKKLVDVQQDIEIDALNDGVGALSSTMQNGFTEAANNFSDIQNSLEAMNLVANDRYNGLTGSVNSLSNAMTQGFLDMGNTVANVSGEIQYQLNQMNVNTVNMNDDIQNQFNGVNIELQNVQNTFELVNTNIGESINAYNEQIKNSLSVDTLSANTLIYNVSADPVASITALGYDSNGKVIPVTVIANSNLQLPPSANYIYTDSAGTPYAGMADTEVSTNENFVTSHAVYNFALNVSNAFNGVNNNLSGIDNTLYFVMDSLGIFTPMNYINSTSPVNYQTLDTVVFTKGNMGNLWSESSLLGNIYYDWNNTTKTLTFSSPTGIITFNSNMSGTFAYCSNLNQNIIIPNNVTDMNSTFAYCSNLNQSIIIPNNVTDMNSTFAFCSNLNQNIIIPNSVTNMNCTFANCLSLNQSILIPNSVTNVNGTFSDCSNLNQSIIIPNSVTNVKYTFFNCSSLNQNIIIPNSVTMMEDTFSYCSNLNQNIIIPNSVTMMSHTFGYCSNLNQNILIPNSVTIMGDVFAFCTNLNQNILIPNSVTNVRYTFFNCSNLNQNIYLYSDRIDSIQGAFKKCYLLSDKYIHIRSSIPKRSSNYIYNSLVNNYTGVNWSLRVVNDLPEPTTWPPVN